MSVLGIYFQENLMWEDDAGWLIVRDKYAGGPRGGRPTATLWHRCPESDIQGDIQGVVGIHNPQVEPSCTRCDANAPPEVVGFWELVRYGVESI